MKLLGNVLLIVCVITGALSAATAYNAPLSLADDKLIGQKLAADVGIVPANDAVFQLAQGRTKELQKALEAAFEAGACEITSDSAALQQPAKEDIAQGVVVVSGSRVTSVVIKPQKRDAKGGEKDASSDETKEDKVVEVDVLGLEAFSFAEQAGYLQLAQRDEKTFEHVWMRGDKFYADKGKVVPLFSSGTVLNADVLAVLRAEFDATSSVRLATFDFFRWPHWWVFCLSAIGLFTGSMLLRVASKRALSLEAKSHDSTTQSPSQLLATIRERIDTLLRDLNSMASEHDRLHAITERIGALQRDEIALFVDARMRVTAEIGLTGYAGMMDRFAAGERKVNRAWSAAADLHEPEARSSLEEVPALLAEAADRLEG